MNQNAKVAIIHLLKGVFYKEDNPNAFFELETNSFGAIKEYLETIGLDVIVDSNEGYAYIKNKVYEEEEEALPKLIQSRELSYKVSLLCVLLRKNIAQFEMQNENEKPIITKEEIIEQMIMFLDIKFNEVKIKKEIESTIKRVEELGFLKKLKAKDEVYEIKPTIKSFVNIEFLEEMDKKLKDVIQDNKNLEE